MPEINNVSLSIKKKLNQQVEVTVAGVIKFSAAELSKRYELSIELRGEDGAGDNLPSTDPLGDERLHQFEWDMEAIWGTIQVPYCYVSASQAGPVPFSETRMLQSSMLDEDEGVLFQPSPRMPPVFWKRRDEIYAVATLKETLSGGTSNTVKDYF